MKISEMLETVKGHPNFDRVGMILCHNGVVRGFSREGQKVKGVEAKVDYEKLKDLVKKMKTRPGIVEILAQVNQGRLSVGEDIMYVLVAGDIRDHVFPVLKETVAGIKKEVLEKEEEIV